MKTDFIVTFAFNDYLLHNVHGRSYKEAAKNACAYLVKHHRFKADQKVICIVSRLGKKLKKIVEVDLSTKIVDKARENCIICLKQNSFL